MKKILIATLATVAMVACSNDELISQAAPEAITFDTFVENATRSVDPSLTLDGLKAADVGFGVYGFVTGDPANADATTAPIFTNEHVTYTDGAWTYGTTQYWIAGATYNFFALAPYTGYDEGNVTDATTTGVNLTFSNTEGTTDLLYAQVNNAAHDTTVGFNFRHILSKVKFTFVNKYDATNTKIQINDIKISNAIQNATVTLSNSTPVWVTNDFTNLKEFNFGAATYYANGVAEPKVPGTYESYKEFLLIPFNYKDDNTAVAVQKLKISFNYDIVVNDVYVKNFSVAPEINVNLEPGKAYNFKATIEHGELIEFSAEIIDWDNDHDGKEGTDGTDNDGDDQVDTPIQ